MPKRKRSEKAPAAVATTTQVQVATQPSPRMQIGVSAVVILHLTGLIVALSANLAPSFLHGELLAWLAPVHVSTGQDYILLPLELTHAEEIEAPVVIQVKRASANPVWEPLQLAVSSGKSPPKIFNSRWPNVSRLMCWIATQQADSEVLPEFAAQAIRRSESLSDKNLDSITGVRFFQPHVLSFDEDLVVEEGQGSYIADALAGKVVYSADVIRSADGSIGLVPEQEPSLTSKPVQLRTNTEEASTP